MDGEGRREGAKGVEKEDTEKREIENTSGSLRAFSLWYHYLA